MSKDSSDLPLPPNELNGSVFSVRSRVSDTFRTGLRPGTHFYNTCVVLQTPSKQEINHSAGHDTVSDSAFLRNEVETVPPLGKSSLIKYHSTQQASIQDPHAPSSIGDLNSSAASSVPQSPCFASFQLYQRDELPRRARHSTKRKQWSCERQLGLRPWWNSPAHCYRTLASVHMVYLWTS